MITFEQDPHYMRIIPHVISAEGGFVNDPKDPGGATKFGVTFRDNADILRRFGITTPAQLEQLTLPEARSIYYQKYWLPSGADKIADLRLAYLHFDATVNEGVGASAHFIERLNKNPRYFKGGNGVNYALFLDLFVDYLAERMRAYAHDPNAHTYLPGWCNRLAAICEERNSL